MTSRVWRERYVYGAGFLAPTVPLGCAAAPAANFGSPEWQYSLFHNTISDLGNTGLSPWHPVFNGGMMAGSLLLIVFTVGTSAIVGSRIGYFVAAMALVANIGMALVGLYPSDPATHEAHMTAAALSFIGILALSGSFTIFVFIDRQDYLPRWLALPALLNVVCTISFFSVLGLEGAGAMEPQAGVSAGDGRPLFAWVPMLEWSVLLTILLWAFLVAWTLRGNLKQRRLGGELG